MNDEIISLNPGTVDCEGNLLHAGDLCTRPGSRDEKALWKIIGAYSVGTGDYNVWVQCGIVNTRVPAARLRLAHRREEVREVVR